MKRLSQASASASTPATSVLGSRAQTLAMPDATVNRSVAARIRLAWAKMSFWVSVIHSVE